MFQSGLVTQEDGGLRITDAGRSVLKAMAGSSEPSFDFPSVPPSQSLKSIDDERQKIFDLDLRKPGEDYSSPPGEEVESANSEDAEGGSAANLSLTSEEHASPVARSLLPRTYRASPAS